MTRKIIYTASILLVSTLVFTACSNKDRSPRLVVHVQDINKTALANAIVRVWPTNASDSNASNVPNPEVDKTHSTDANGDATFEYEFSAVLDVDVEFLKSSLDTGSNLIIDTLEGHKVVKIEVIRQKGEENVFNETITVE